MPHPETAESRHCGGDRAEAPSCAFGEAGREHEGSRSRRSLAGTKVCRNAIGETLLSDKCFAAIMHALLQRQRRIPAVSRNLG
jgi:hypothetical protein